MTFTGNWLHDTFENPLAYGGHEGNFQAYVNTLTLAPGATKSLLHFVVLGQRVTTATSDAERLKVEATATTLAATPEIGDLTPAEVCSIENFSGLPCTPGGDDPAHSGPGRAARGHDLGLRRGREDDRPDARRHGVGSDHLAGDHARLPRPDRGLRQGPVRLQRVRDRRFGRDRAGAQGRRGARGGQALARARHPDRGQEPLRHLRHGDHQRQHDLRGLPPEAGRLPDRQAARGRRRDHRQGRARGVRDERQLLQRPVGPGLERVRTVEVGARLVRRLRHGGGGQPRRRRHGLADR